MGATQILSEYIAKVNFSDLPRKWSRKPRDRSGYSGVCDRRYTLAGHEFHWIYDLAKRWEGIPNPRCGLPG